MRKGFTMIELIFVIVILGILAAVAIPKLAATRDDAEISKAASNVATAVADIGSYYTAQGEFGKWDDMTQVPFSATGLTDVSNPSGGGAGTAGTATLNIKGKGCVKFTAEVNGTLWLAQGTDSSNKICTSFYEIPEFAELKGGAGALPSTNVVVHTFGGSHIKR